MQYSLFYLVDLAVADHLRPVRSGDSRVDRRPPKPRRGERR